MNVLFYTIFISSSETIQYERRPIISMSTLERSKQALQQLKSLLNSVRSENDQPWIWEPTSEYPSVPYQPTSLLTSSSPKITLNISVLPRLLTMKVDDICQRLISAQKSGGEIWCQLFNKSFSSTLITTTSLLDDETTYIITGDIDLMWLRDSR
jgi:hypothetical protein